MGMLWRTSLATIVLAGCTVTPARDAAHAAWRYADALNSRDYDTMIALTDPEVLKRTENGAELRPVLKQVLEGEVHVREEIRSISPGFSDANGMHYFVSTSRDARRSDGAGVIVNSYYIVTSRDLGKTWTIVDISCVDERWIKAIAPGWTGYPPAPAQSITQYSVDHKLIRRDGNAP
jgi:hypothetical protein